MLPEFVLSWVVVISLLSNVCRRAAEVARRRLEARLELHPYIKTLLLRPLPAHIADPGWDIQVCRATCYKVVFHVQRLAMLIGSAADFTQPLQAPSYVMSCQVLLLYRLLCT